MYVTLKQKVFRLRHFVVHTLESCFLRLHQKLLCTQVNCSSHLICKVQLTKTLKLKCPAFAVNHLHISVVL